MTSRVTRELISIFHISPEGPARVIRTTLPGYVREQWVYGDGRYVYLDDGIGTAIQN